MGRWKARISRNRSIFLWKGSYLIVPCLLLLHSLITSSSYCEGRVSSEALRGDCSLGGKWEQVQNLWKYRCNPPHCKGTCLPLLPFSVPTFHPYPLSQPSPGSRLQQQTGYRDFSSFSLAFTSCCPQHQKEISTFGGEGLVSPRPKEEKLFLEELQGLAV